MRGGAGAAGPAVPPVLREAHVHVRALLPQQARLRVHRVGTRPLLPGAEAQIRTQAAGKYAIKLHGLQATCNVQLAATLYHALYIN